MPLKKTSSTLVANEELRQLREDAAKWQKVKSDSSALVRLAVKYDINPGDYTEEDVVRLALDTSARLAAKSAAIAAPAEASQPQNDALFQTLRVATHNLKRLEALGEEFNVEPLDNSTQDAIGYAVEIVNAVARGAILVLTHRVLTQEQKNNDQSTIQFDRSKDQTLVPPPAEERRDTSAHVAGEFERPEAPSKPTISAERKKLIDEMLMQGHHALTMVVNFPNVDLNAAPYSDEFLAYMRDCFELLIDVIASQLPDTKAFPRFQIYADTGAFEKPGFGQLYLGTDGDSINKNGLGNFQMPRRIMRRLL